MVIRLLITRSTLNLVISNNVWYNTILFNDFLRLYSQPQVASQSINVSYGPK